jgi:hypothetical protein
MATRSPSSTGTPALPLLIHSVGLEDREDLLFVGNALAMQDTAADLIAQELAIGDVPVKIGQQGSGQVEADVQLGTGIARAGKELLGQGQVVATGLLDLGLTRRTFVRVFGGGALQALQAPIEPLELADVVFALAPVAQALAPAQLRTGLDGFAHGIQEQVEVGGVVHVGLGDEGVSARVEPFLGAFFLPVGARHAPPPG